MSGTGRKPRFVYEFRGDASLSTFRGLISASSMVAPTGREPVFESRSRFRQVSYVVTDQPPPATSTRLKHAAESSLKHPEHDHVKREPGGPSPANENYKTISGRAPSRPPLRAPNSGSGACTRPAWRWARSSGSFGTSAEPGESVQVDVKFVKIAGRWAFQYTALDDCTRRRLLS